MNDNAKAKAILDMAEKTAAELRAEGKPIMAEQTLAAFKDVPVGSLAKFYDLVSQFRTKDEALASMGATA